MWISSISQDEIDICINYLTGYGRWRTNKL